MELHLARRGARRICCSVGSSLEVLEPLEIRERIIATAGRILERYEREGPVVVRAVGASDGRCHAPVTPPDAAVPAASGSAVVHRPPRRRRTRTAAADLAFAVGIA